MEEEKDQRKEPEPKEDKAPPKEAEKPAAKEEPTTKEREPKKDEKSLSNKEEKPSKARVRAANCLNCNKALKKRKWYYRDNKYYCNKRCWKAYKAKSASKKA